MRFFTEVLGLFFLGLIVCALWVVSLPDPVQAQSSHLTWTHEACSTLDCVDDVLNKLPLDRALEAKIVVINSQRSFLGA